MLPRLGSRSGEPWIGLKSYWLREWRVTDYVRDLENLLTILDEMNLNYLEVILTLNVFMLGLTDKGDVRSP